MGLRDDDRILGAIPMSHSYGFSSVVLPALRRGSILVVPDEEGPLAPLRAARATRRHRLPQRARLPAGAAQAVAAAGVAGIACAS